MLSTRLLPALLLLSLALPMPARAAEPPLAPLSTDEILRGARYNQPRLSPDGRYLAMLAERNGRMNLAVLDVESGKFESKLAVADADISDARWLGNERLVFTLAQRGQSRNKLALQGGLFVSSRDGQTMRRLYQTANDWIMKGGRRYTQMWPYQPVPGSSEELIVATNEGDKDSIDLYRLNALTSKRQLLTGQRPPRVKAWVLDAQLQPRVAIADLAESSTQIVHYRESKGPWRELWRFDVTREAIRRPLSVEADGKLLVASNEGRDTVALREYDPASGQWGEWMIEHPQYDVAYDALGDDLAPLLRDEQSHELLGATILATRPLYAWMDSRRQAMQALVDKALPDRVNRLQFSASQRIFVSSHSDTQAPSWYLLDGGSGRLSHLLDTRAELDARRVPATEILALRSRDGLALPSYLLRPPQALANALLPTLVLVHGGPWVRGAVWGDWNGGDLAMAQWLASRGYQVLLPSFRGSAGLGKKAMQASRGQFGLAMQDDLDDALDALIRRGGTDPQRLCIMGSSYGGYASLMAAARAPERYRCAVAGFPVTDLPTLLSSDWSDISRSKEGRAFWTEMVGDPVQQVDALKAVSPRYLAARIKAKVMIYAGVDDPRVPLEQAESMREALERAGNKPLWLAKYGDGHGFSLTRNHDEMLEMLEPFLAEQLRPGR